MGIIFADSFTEASADTVLTAHAPGTGTGWTQEFITAVGGEAINAFFATDYGGAAASVTAGGIGYSAQPNPSTADYDVQLTVVTPYASTGSRPLHLLARLVDGSNFYSGFAANGQCAGNDKRVCKVVAGTTTEIAGYDDGDVIANDVFKFELRGTALKLYKNANVLISTSDTAFSAAGKAGLGMGAIGSLAYHIRNTWKFDNFSVDEAVVAATSFIPPTPNRRAVRGLKLGGRR